MPKFFQLWTSCCQGRAICYNIVRNASRKARKYVPNFQEFIAKETGLIFGPASSSDGTPVIKKKDKTFTGDSRNNSNVLHKAQTKTSMDASLHSRDVAAGQQTDIHGSRRPSLVRELDSILTFPMGKTMPKDSKALIPSVNVQTDIPILASHEVTSLNKRVSLPSVSKVLEKSRPPEEQAVLDRWKEKMISELGEEGFALWQKGINVQLLGIVVTSDSNTVYLHTNTVQVNSYKFLLEYLSIEGSLPDS